MQFLPGEMRAFRLSLPPAFLFCRFKESTMTRVAAAILSVGLGISARAQTVNVSYSYNDHPLIILPAAANVATVAQIAVPAGLTISNVTVQVNIQYPNVGDLVVALFSAQGTRTVLLSNNCNGLANVNTTFNDAAPSKFSDFCPQEAGRGPFRGEQPLANSRGEFAGGYWQLVVQNTRSNASSGVLLGFTLNITGTPVTQPNFNAASVVNAASGVADGVVAPGELIAIFGVGLGPQQGVSGDPTHLPTSLAGTTVTFDGAPAPILYASYYQVNVQVPYSVKPGTTTQMKLQSTGGVTGNVPMDVLSSAVGLFTAQSNGAGQVLAVNGDGTVNSISNPAAPGSYVSLYATGLGAVTPPVDAGIPAPSTPLSTITGNIAVIVGGLSAPVTFAGLAPGFTGLYQINIQLPSTLGPGARRVFIVAANGYASQPGAFIQVR